MVFRMYGMAVKPYVMFSSSPLFHRPFKIRAQCFRDDQGRFNKMVDSNLGVLRERIEEVKTREKLERCLSCKHNYGWNYVASYDYKLQKDKQFSEFLQILFLITASLGFTFLSGTFSLCLLSFLLHFHH
ncbi:hypothetical protein IC575_021859 [Cucumis melo]